MKILFYILYSIIILGILGAIYHSVLMLLTDDRDEQDYHGYTAIISIIIVVIGIVIKEFLTNYIF